MKTHKDARKIRRIRVRSKIVGTAKRPRMSIFRSDKYLYAQLIDDAKGETLTGQNDRNFKEKNKLERARILGRKMAQTALDMNISRIIYDRAGYAYHGRVKAIAEGLREGGLKF